MSSLSEQEHLRWLEERYQLMFVQILNQISLLEDKIDELITRCFFGTTQIQWEFVDIILGDVLLSQKINKLQRTLKVLHPTLSQDFQEKNVAKRFNKIRKVRNYFAHSVLNTQKEYLDKARKDEIALLNFRYNPPHVQILFADFEKHMEDAQKLYTLLDSYCLVIQNP